MFIKKYKVVTKDGKNAPQLFDSIKDALKTVGASKIKKLEEVNYEEEISDTSIDKRNFVLISRKTNEEVELSNKTGYAVTFSRPVLTKVFVGMPILEVGVDTILESTVSMIGRYDKNAHKGWDVDGKEWEWVLYHKRGNVLSIEEAKKKYGDFDKALGRDGVISYTPKLK